MSLREAAETAVEQCLGLDAEESCVVVTDDDRQPIGEALYEVASEVSEDTTILRYPPGEQHGAEPPGPVAAAMRDADVSSRRRR
ncbi:aminopeptidase, partial [Halobacterium sp. PCN9]|nr:aminopeptidase [Halobacterium bonnevillei]